MRRSFAVAGRRLPDSVVPAMVSRRCGESWLHLDQPREDLAADGVVVSNGFVSARCGRLGEAPLFVLEDDVAAGRWLLTNDRFLAARVSRCWAADAGLTPLQHLDRVGALAAGEFRAWSAHPKGWLQERWSASAARADGGPTEPGPSLAAASSRVESELRHAVARQVSGRSRPVVLLSGGVDSGLVAAFALAANPGTIALTLGTPWGDEADRAAETAAHLGLALEFVRLDTDRLVSGVSESQIWLQHGDVETCLIQLLVSQARSIAGSLGDLLITGMGSDLLNSPNDTGMSLPDADEGGVDEPDLAERVAGASASGLFQTGVLHPLAAGGVPIAYPYWEAPTVAAQLAVPGAYKEGNGTEKFYLRRLAETYLPSHIAWGRKFAIHQGGGLAAGLVTAMKDDGSCDDPIGNRWISTVSHQLDNPDKDLT